MRLLLDTHALIWVLFSSAELSAKVREIVGATTNEIYVSAATAWEISTKVRLGKLPQAERLEREFEDAMNRAGYTPLPIEPNHSLRAGRLIGEHKDPFDRMLAAQALAMDIPIISSDEKLDQFGVRRIW